MSCSPASVPPWSSGIVDDDTGAPAAIGVAETAVSIRRDSSKYSLRMRSISVESALSSSSRRKNGSERSFIGDTCMLPAPTPAPAARCGDVEIAFPARFSTDHATGRSLDGDCFELDLRIDRVLRLGDGDRWRDDDADDDDAGDGFRFTLSLLVLSTDPGICIPLVFPRPDRLFRDVFSTSSADDDEVDELDVDDDADEMLDDRVELSDPISSASCASRSGSGNAILRCMPENPAIPSSALPRRGDPRKGDPRERSDLAGLACSWCRRLPEISSTRSCCSVLSSDIELRRFFFFTFFRTLRLPDELSRLSLCSRLLCLCRAPRFVWPHALRIASSTAAFPPPPSMCALGLPFPEYPVCIARRGGPAGVICTGRGDEDAPLPCRPAPESAGYPPSTSDLLRRLLE
eukprot:comp20868_c0_seq1/m.43350 comp20868_c0_seq1/g.43350  ORF comp20868_c0_seq1/g.43350 comp20868_c0_seq1/m.43350 type:complete len:404 (+) comp20868_c0_seq1:854-2065(+)